MESTRNKIVTKGELHEKLAGWRQAGMQIVFTNGCFDLLHVGHVDYLEKARALGDKLVIGLNSDASVRNIKGPERPILQQDSRAILLAALAFTDAVVFFDEDTPEQLIKEVSPDILVKGNDYHVGNIIGADFVLQNGGKVKTIELVEGFSTTNIIQKIKNLK